MLPAYFSRTFCSFRIYMIAISTFSPLETCRGPNTANSLRDFSVDGISFHRSSSTAVKRARDFDALTLWRYRDLEMRERRASGEIRAASSALEGRPGPGLRIGCVGEG